MIVKATDKFIGAKNLPLRPVEETLDLFHIIQQNPLLLILASFTLANDYEDIAIPLNDIIAPQMPQFVFPDDD